MRKLVAGWMVVAIVFLVPASGWAATATLPSKLTTLEEMIYGRAQQGSLLERVNRLERDFYGDLKQGPLLVRLEDIHDELLRGGLKGGSLLLRLNAVEWMIYQEVTASQPLNRRIEHIEMGVWGERQPGPLSERLANMMDLVWPGGKLNVAEMEVPAETLVRIRMVDEVNSSQNRVNQTIRYRVADDVMVNERLVIASGAEGQARVANVETAGALGRSGRVELDFGSVRAVDGTEVRMNVDEKASKQNTEMAAAASVAGVVLLGPIGLVGGYFVRGEEHVIPAGTEFYVEVARPVEVQALSLTPVLE